MVKVLDTSDNGEMSQIATEDNLALIGLFIVSEDLLKPVHSFRQSYDALVLRRS